MFIKNLKLLQFKNHSKSKFTFTNPVNCFVGSNGAGKTNILDAIHYLSQTKSYFNHIDSQNIMFDENYFILKGIFDKNGTISDIQCNYKSGEGKIVKKNNKKYKRFSEHIGQFPIIIISPTDTNLILEDSDVRRRYIDSSIAQYKQSYLQVLIQYNRILKQRNAILKQFFDQGNYDGVILKILNKQLAENGNIIFKERKKFLKQLQPVFDKYYSEISESKESVSIKYKSQLNDSLFIDLLSSEIFQYKNYKTTQVGTHKDDIIFMMNNLPIKKIGSQGQQKSFLIALKLAQFDFIKQQLGFKPILLLDDIFDKLDDNRILKLISFVDKDVFGQVFITDTHAERSAEILERAGIIYSIYKIENGEINYE